MKTILAVQPDAIHLAYAVFKGTTLVDKGSGHIAFRKPLRQRTYQKTIPFFRELVELHKPDVVVLPNPTYAIDTARNRFLRAMQYEVGRAHQKYTIVSFGRKDIRKMFKGFLKAQGTGKDSTMRLLTQWFPELLEFLPAPRRAWDPPNYWVPMFDAVSLAVTYLHQNE